MLKREDILSKTDLRKEKIHVEEWGGDVFVSEMSGEARDAWEQLIIKKDRDGSLINVRAKLVIATVVDEKGNRLFTENDVDLVGKLSGDALDKICKVSQRVNKLTDAELSESLGN